jgi:hypothetical protein
MNTCMVLVTDLLVAVITADVSVVRNREEWVKVSFYFIIKVGLTLLEFSLLEM